MCGIAGYIGWQHIPEERIEKTLTLMKRRGPDVQSYSVVEGSNDMEGTPRVLFLHSRLSIIDLSSAANQPFTDGSSHLVFNGELYNYVELREELKKQGAVFQTNSDTEVLLQSYNYKGFDCFQSFEGMWGLGIWDAEKKELLLSRDRFGEKPLYYFENDSGLYFASEIKFLMSLSGVKFPVNKEQIYRFLLLGYKSLYKTGDTYFEGVMFLPSSSVLSVAFSRNGLPYLNKSLTKYWKPYSVIKPMSLKEACEGVRHHLYESIRIRLRSDVPLAFCLSGGVDSSSLVSIARKKFNADLTTFSIIDPDERYNEYSNVENLIKDLEVENIPIHLKHEPDLERLRNLVRYHDSPISTVSYFVHSFLSESIAEKGFRVAFSGTGADEIFTGYYDHFLLHLNEVRGHPEYDRYLSDWESGIKKHVRNPHLSNPLLYEQTPHFRAHIYDNSEEFMSWIYPEKFPHFESSFSEEFFSDSLLRNRMMNELFHEIVPVVLHEDDLNSMFYSVENRSPYLDSRLCEFLYSVPAEHLIRDGYAKYLLRESVKGILPDSIRLDRVKKGFNASINSIFDLRSPLIREEVFDRKHHFSDIIDVQKMAELFDSENIPNHYSKFIFNLLNVIIFIEESS